MLRRINSLVEASPWLANKVWRIYTAIMTDKYKTDDAQSDEIEELSRRFVKLWQQQLSLLAEGDASSLNPEDWMTGWNDLIQSGMSQGGMPIKGPSAMQNFPHNMAMDYWKSIIPGSEVNHDMPESERAASTHERTSDNTRTDAADRPPSASATSIDTINILRQLTSYVERLDQRLTKLENQSVSSKPATKRPKSRKGSAKKPKDKSTK